MSQPKYKIGDRLTDINLTVCGYLKLSNGEYRYYLQIGNSDNTLVLNDLDLEFLVEYRLMRLSRTGDAYGQRYAIETSNDVAG